MFEYSRNKQEKEANGVVGVYRDLLIQTSKAWEELYQIKTTLLKQDNFDIAALFRALAPTTPSASKDSLFSFLASYSPYKPRHSEINTYMRIVKGFDCDSLDYVSLCKFLGVSENSSKRVVSNIQFSRGIHCSYPAKTMVAKSYLSPDREVSYTVKRLFAQLLVSAAEASRGIEERIAEVKQRKKNIQEKLCKEFKVETKRDNVSLEQLCIFTVLNTSQVEAALRSLSIKSPFTPEKLLDLPSFPELMHSSTSDYIKERLENLEERYRDWKDRQPQQVFTEGRIATIPRGVKTDFYPYLHTYIPSKGKIIPVDLAEKNLHAVKSHRTQSTSLPEDPRLDYYRSFLTVTTPDTPIPSSPLYKQDSLSTQVTTGSSRSPHSDNHHPLDSYSIIEEDTISDQREGNTRYVKEMRKTAKMFGSRGLENPEMYSSNYIGGVYVLPPGNVMKSNGEMVSTRLPSSFREINS